MCLRNRQYRIELSPGSGACHAISSKSVQILSGHTDAGEKYGRDRLIAACACADQKLQYGYQALREVLELGEDADFLPDEDGKIQPDMTSPIPLTHKNIRGRDYYRKDKQEQ